VPLQGSDPLLLVRMNSLQIKTQIIGEFALKMRMGLLENAWHNSSVGDTKSTEFIEFIGGVSLYRCESVFN